MFTGIVQGTAVIKHISREPDLSRFTIEFPPGALEGVDTGASISISGCCLTVVSTAGNAADFELVRETLQRSTLGSAHEGAIVNFERSLRYGDEIGGHLLSGHVDTVARVIKVEHYERSKIVTFEVEDSWHKFLFEKGYVAIDGASLTIAATERSIGQFTISLIPETLSRTTFATFTEGRTVNVEIDRNTQAIVETVEWLLLDRGLIR